MRRQPPIQALFVAISVLVIVACHGVTEPITAGTTFVLESVGGASLPAVSGTIPSGAVLIADTLVFLSSAVNDSGEVVHHGTVQVGGITTRTSYVRLYRWHDGVLSFHSPPCPPGAECLNGSAQSTSETGRFGPDNLTITYGTPGVFPLTYRRLN